jgi:hypothetical protein
VETIAQVSFKFETDDPVAELWQTMRELAEAGAWRRTLKRELERVLPERGHRVLEAAYDAAGREVQLVVMNHPYLAEAVFQVRINGSLESSYVSPANALSDYTALTTVPGGSGR